MEKAYDVKILKERIKAKGLDIAEEALVILVDQTLGWMEDSAKMSENKWDDMIAVFASIAKPMIMEQIDKIDGEVG
jgi:hypothetical protein